MLQCPTCGSDMRARLSGLQLRALRVARGLRAADIARVLGTSDRTIRSREREALPPRQFVEKYIAALGDAQDAS